nr:MAG TPA: hypothetical protein [Bacteriophage sp.]
MSIYSLFYLVLITLLAINLLKSNFCLLLSCPIIRKLLFNICSIGYSDIILLCAFINTLKSVLLLYLFIAYKRVYTLYIGLQIVPILLSKTWPLSL